MTVSVDHKHKLLYAVAVREGSDLFLTHTICLDPKTDVYINWIRDHDPDWKPHTSYHASGQYHHKSNGVMIQKKKRQNPDENFSGTENVIQTGIAIDEHRRIHTPYRKTDFQGLFEIPVSDLKPEPGRIQLSVDLAEPKEQPILAPGAKIIRQAVFQDSVPWIMCTLLDTGAD